MRYAALFFVLTLTACSREPFHMTDISGAMPRLDFRLTRASDGKPVTGESYRGQVVVLYFGYTNCPDICPATLANMAGVLSKVGSKDVRLLFVTVDPKRDTPPVLNRYVHAFSPQFDGLRGSDEDLADVARRYRVAYSVDAKPPYTVMHSNAVFFFDPAGRIRLVTTDTTDTDAIAEDVRRLL
ncbi:MAG TPA: SCO family protein [Rhizomicrobium sp.]|nr:SCO family protein [Rhizomicrobium sp.]